MSQALATELGFVHIPELDLNTTLDGIEERAATRAEMLVHLDRQGVNMVVDRSPLSSFVYSSVYERGTNLSHARAALREIDGILVYLSCDPTELAIRYDDELHEDVAEIAEMYEEVVNNEPHLFDRVFRFDTSTGLDDFVRETASEVNCRE